MKLMNHVADMTRYIPGFVGDKLRYHLYSKVCAHVGKDVDIKDGVVMLDAHKISIGDHSGINQHCYLNAHGGIEIGKYVRLAPHSALISTNHIFVSKDKPISLQGESPAKIVIEDDVWIGYGAVITKGVRIGKGSVIGANATVTKDVPPYSLIVGNNVLVGKRK